MLRPFLSAISFLTIIPVPGSIHRDRRALQAAPAYYPIPGFLIGLAAVLVASLTVPAPLKIVLLTALPFVLSRAMHLDGLADTCDGLLGGRDPEERRRIMHDPGIGAFGALAVALDVVARTLLYGAVMNSAPVALLAAPVLGRWSLTFALFLSPYSPRGKLKEAVTSPGWSRMLIATGWIVAFMVATRRASDLVALATLAVAGLTAIWVSLVKRKTGFISGDTLGALNEMAEILVLVFFLDWWS